MAYLLRITEWQLVAFVASMTIGGYVALAVFPSINAQSPIPKKNISKLSLWADAPNIDPAERAARRVLGFQIYDAKKCGLVATLDQTTEYWPDIGEDPQKVIKAAIEQNKKHVPFIYHIEIREWGSRIDDPNLYLTDKRAIVGTRGGEVYEFRWDRASTQSNMVFTHQKWRKPVVKISGKDVLFFDAEQSDNVLK